MTMLPAQMMLIRLNLMMSSRKRSRDELVAIAVFATRRAVKARRGGRHCAANYWTMVETSCGAELRRRLEAEGNSYPDLVERRPE